MKPGETTHDSAAVQRVEPRRELGATRFGAIALRY